MTPLTEIAPAKIACSAYPYRSSLPQLQRGSLIFFNFCMLNPDILNVGFDWQTSLQHKQNALETFYQKLPRGTFHCVVRIRLEISFWYCIYSFLLFSCSKCILFIFQSPGTLNHVESMSLDGRKTKGALFGYAMAVAGDLNRDGFPGRTKPLNVVVT